MRGNLRKASILIVSDEPSVGDIISRKLNDEGHKCTVACDGNSASKKLDARHFDLVLLDIRLPGESGLDILRQIQVNYPDTAVIVMTAIADVETAVKSMKMGAYDYIVKPVDLNMLTISIDRALDKRRLMLENRNYQLHIEDRLEEQTRKIRESFLNSIKSLAYALEAKDKYTSGHSQSVTELAVAIAQELGISQDMVEKIRLAGLVHDIGKIGVRESVLNKPGNLTGDEYQHVMSHCEIGERILSPIIEDEEILKMVRHHHEHYDGSGYPDSLSVEQIPQGARILAVADAYDAMTSGRLYQQATSLEAACAELEKGKGKQFDPVIVDAFLKVMSGDKRYESCRYALATSR